ncbi:MAG: HD domain-containing protein [Spirochaetia bacterium]|nr:HD domain-containing protein [Spirochaetia bacterium]
MQSLEIEKYPFIKDIQKGLLEEGRYLIKRIHMNTGKSGKPFLRIMLSDMTGHLPGVYFGSAKELASLQKTIKEGDVLKISGIMEEFHQVLQIKILKLQKEDKKKIDLERFRKRTPHDRRKLFQEIESMLNNIQNKELKELAMFFLNDKELMTLFLDAPASRFVHHAYIGGLLEHTINVMKLVVSYSQIYVHADKSLLLTAAFLHDLGKIEEYIFLLEDIDYSSEAKLKGHTLLGYEKLKEAFEKIKVDDKLKIKLEHMILSHQGKKIWGAVVEPKFLEAYLLHAADSTDAAQFIFSELRKETRPANPKEHIWSDYISYLGREIYLG